MFQQVDKNLYKNILKRNSEKTKFIEYLEDKLLKKQIIIERLKNKLRDV